MSNLYLDTETDRLARRLADLTGKTLAEAVREGLLERLEKLEHEPPDQRDLTEQLMAIGRQCAALPDIDPRSPDDIIGYGRAGVPV